MLTYPPLRIYDIWKDSFFDLARTKSDKKVMYIPIGQFSPITLQKIRVFHVLDGYEVRNYAREYIW